jgi:TadE-like protein
MAVMVPFLVIGMMGFLDLGRAFYYQIGLTNAVREAARYAALPQYTGLFPDCSGATPPSYTPTATCPTPSDQQICDRVNQELTNTGFSIQCSDIRILPNQQGRVNNYNAGTQVIMYQLQVQGTYRFHFITPIIGSLIGDPLAINTSATFRSEY